MSQVTGAFTVELDLDRLADEIAVRVAGALHEMGHGRPAGGETYERDPGPDPGAGTRRGARFGGVVDRDGTVELDQNDDSTHTPPRHSGQEP